MKIPITIFLEREDIENIDKKRGDVPRSLYLRNIIHKELKDGKTK